jgi:hypothetical protein
METLLRGQGYKPNIVVRCESPETIKTAVTKKAEWEPCTGKW